LLKGLLEKNVEKRLNWQETLRHPFWEGKLLHLIPTGISKTTATNGRNDVNQHEIYAELTNRLSLNTSKLGLDQKPEMNVSFSIRQAEEFKIR
jgi:hypothetical protein